MHTQPWIIPYIYIILYIKTYLLIYFITYLKTGVKSLLNSRNHSFSFVQIMALLKKPKVSFFSSRFLSVQAPRSVQQEAQAFRFVWCHEPARGFSPSIIDFIQGECSRLPLNRMWFSMLCKCVREPETPFCLLNRWWVRIDRLQRRYDVCSWFCTLGPLEIIYIRLDRTYLIKALKAY